MKQLLIVNSVKALNAGITGPFDLSGLEPGAITFFELGGSTLLSTKPTKNFGIALGRGNNAPAFVIPEVDVNTLIVSVAEPKAGRVFTSTFTCPAPTAGKDETFTAVIVKKNVVFHERNTWTSTVSGKDKTAAQVASALVANINAKAEAGGLDVAASVNGADVTVTGKNIGEDFELKLGDKLFGVSTTTVNAEKNVGDTAYVADLARKCAAGKGFEYVYGEGKEIYPGYPEKVEDIAQAAIASKGYTVFNLHFATGRVAGKQLDERVWQDVIIAVPTDNASLATIKTILGQPVLVNEPAASGNNQ